jgi:hypothetical protein
MYRSTVRIRFAAVGAAAGWMALATWPGLIAAQIKHDPGRSASLLASAPLSVSAGPAWGTAPITPAAPVDQCRPQPPWAGALGRAAKTASNSLARLAGLVYFCHTGGIYGP